MISLIDATPVLLVLTAYAIKKGGSSCRSYWIAWVGLAMTILSNHFLITLKAPAHTHAFMYGVMSALLAHLCWIIFLRRHATLNLRVALGLFASLGLLFAVRLLPAFHDAYWLAGAIALHIILTIVCVAYAFGKHTLSRMWRYAFCTLAGSDLMLGYNLFLYVPDMEPLIELTYLISLAGIAIAIARCAQKPTQANRIRYLRTVPLIVVLGGFFVTLLFSFSMACCPNMAYNPYMRMLSYLGRTQINNVNYPLCHYLFMGALIISVGIVAFFYPALSCFVKNNASKTCLRWGGTLNATGLLIIAFIPENTSEAGHNIGCFLAAAGAAVTIITLAFKRNNPKVPSAVRWGWLIWGFAVIATFEFFLLAHQFRLLPFAPYVPTVQKIVILTFAAWMINYALLLFNRTHPSFLPRRNNVLK